MTLYVLLFPPFCFCGFAYVPTLSDVPFYMSKHLKGWPCQSISNSLRLTLNCWNFEVCSFAVCQLCNFATLLLESLYRRLLNIHAFISTSMNTLYLLLPFLTLGLFYLLHSPPFSVLVCASVPILLWVCICFCPDPFGWINGEQSERVLYKS